MRNADAYNFLEGFERDLVHNLPRPEILRSMVRKAVADAKSDDKAKHKRQFEDAFLHDFAFPTLFRYLQSSLGLTELEAKQALLSEYYRNMREMCSGTPAHRQRHPFDKTIGSKPSFIMDQWKGRAGVPLKQSCPDFALRATCRFTVVFGGKYFERGGRKKAETDLVTNIYQSFFYRSLPKVEPIGKGPAWDYEFACLCACDASPDGSLYTAWNGLERKVRAGFWDGANLYVMVLRNDQAAR